MEMSALPSPFETFLWQLSSIIPCNLDFGQKRSENYILQSSTIRPLVRTALHEVQGGTHNYFQEMWFMKRRERRKE